jgi:hypothetical protein
MFSKLSLPASRALATHLSSLSPEIKAIYGKVDNFVQATELTHDEIAQISTFITFNQVTELLAFIKQKEDEAFGLKLALTARGLVLSGLTTIAWVWGMVWCGGIVYLATTLCAFVSVLIRCNTTRVRGTQSEHGQASDGFSSPAIMWMLGGGYAVLATVHYFQTPLKWLMWIPMFFMRVFAAPVLAYLHPVYEYLRAQGLSIVSWVQSLQHGWTSPDPSAPEDDQTSAANSTDECSALDGTTYLCDLSKLLGGLGGADNLRQTLRYLLAAALVVNASYIMVDAQTGEQLALPAHAPLPSFVEQGERIRFHRRPDMGFDQEDVKTKFQRAAEEKQAQDEKKPVDSGSSHYGWYVSVGYTLGVSILGNAGVQVGKHAFNLMMAWAVRRAPHLGAYAPYVRILVAAVPGLAVQQLGETSLGWHTFSALATSGAVWQSFTYIGEWIVKQWGGDALATDADKAGADANPAPLSPAGAAAAGRAGTGTRG